MGGTVVISRYSIRLPHPDQTAQGPWIRVQTSVLPFAVVVGPCLNGLASSLRFFIASDFTQALMSPRFLLPWGILGPKCCPAGLKTGLAAERDLGLATCPRLLLRAYFQHTHASSAMREGALAQPRTRVYGEIHGKPLLSRLCRSRCRGETRNVSQWYRHHRHHHHL